MSEDGMRYDNPGHQNFPYGDDEESATQLEVNGPSLLVRFVCLMLLAVVVGALVAWLEGMP